jgi:hypothetical protein
VAERARRRQHGVPARPQARQAFRQRARPALDAAELRADGGSRVDGDQWRGAPGAGLVRVGQRA